MKSSRNSEATHEGAINSDRKLLKFDWNTNSIFFDHLPYQFSKLGLRLGLEVRVSLVLGTKALLLNFHRAGPLSAFIWAPKDEISSLGKPSWPASHI